MVIFMIIIFYTVQYFLYNDAENRMQTNTAKIMAEIKMENNNLAINPSVAPGCNFAVISPAGEILFNNTGWENITKEPEWEKTIRVTIDGEDLLLLDTPIYNSSTFIGWLRVVLSTDSIENAMGNVALLSLFIIPVYIAAAVAGSLFLAKTALKPIDKVTFTARQIGNGDFSKRISTKNTKDEVGRLISTFNEMLENLETAFIREKQFTSDASHELRTPLSVIRVNAEEALHGEKTDVEYKEALEKITSESKKMGIIISQLLTLTRGYDSKLAINKENFNLVAVICDVVSEMEILTEGYGVTIQYDQTEDIIIHADHMLITQMLINLISNSCKYGKAGGVVTIAVEVSGENIVITVKDDGIGISKEDLGHIFERFYRADKSHSGDSSGLGLSIVMWIVDVHSGKIAVESELEKGTSMKIKIPCKDIV